MTSPPARLIRKYDTHRLIAAKYSDESVLAELADDDSDLAALFDLDHATNDRLLAENERVVGIGTRELVFGVPYARIVNAAFCHPHPLGSRFNGPDRGAWYAAFELETAQAELAFHKSLELLEVGWLQEEATYVDFLADFSAVFHDLRACPEYAACLAQDSYVAAQELAERLLVEGSLGVVYPSVRRAGGTCVACFQPALVGNVRKTASYVFRWDGSPEPRVSEA